MDDAHHHHHQAPTGPDSGSPNDVRPAHVFSGYPQQYPTNGAPAPSMPPLHDGLNNSHHSAIVARRRSRDDEDDDNNPEGLFPDVPEAKKRKFILVDDNKRGCRLRVRVELEDVNTKEIPDSFRKRTSVFPRSYFPREMQSPPPSATGSRFFQDDLSDDDVEVDGGRTGRSRGKTVRDTVMVKVPMSDGNDGEVAVPRMRKSTRTKEVRLNDLGYRLVWRHSRAFASKTIFLQRACKSGADIYTRAQVKLTSAIVDCYRNRTRDAIGGVAKDVRYVAPHFETRVGKRRWNERMRRGDKREDE